MGNFLACFGSSKDRKHQKQTNKVLPRDQRYGSDNPVQHTVSSEKIISETPTNSILELQDRSDEQLRLSNRKKVTFDSNVKTHEHVSVHKSTDILPEGDRSIEEDSFAESSLFHSLSENSLIKSGIVSYPQNHSYQNCRDNDDTVEELEDEDSDLDDDEEEEKEKEDYGDYDEDGDYRIAGEEAWLESIPTTSMKSRTEISSATVVLEEEESLLIMSGLPKQDVKTIGLSRNARDQSVFVQSVLNPVENLSQWKAVKSKGTPSLKSDKENCIGDREAPRISFSSEQSFKESSFSFKSNYEQSKNLNREIAFDASLSNWLLSSETTPTKKSSSSGLETIASEKSMPQGSNSVRSIGDKPILGALTVEDLKQFSLSSSPRRSPSQSPDEMPIIGTVGTYWNHTSTANDSGSASSYKGIPNTTSKYREDKRVNWHSTPFETRLERALNRDASKA